jgi:hypothetical protein
MNVRSLNRCVICAQRKPLRAYLYVCFDCWRTMMRPQRRIGMSWPFAKYRRPRLQPLRNKH